MDDASNTGAAPASRRSALIVGVGVAAALAGAGYAWMRSRQPAPASVHGPGAAGGTGAGAIDQAGVEQFWPLEFETPQGAKLAMASFKGRPLLLNFWATWCAPCIEEMPMLDAFYRQNTAKGWQLLGLAIDQPSSVRKFLDKTAVSYPIGLAGFGGTELTKALGNTAGGLPFSVVFDKEGKLRQRKIGRLSEADLQAWLGLA
ncbi:MAG TPA: TlpA disulfide reductase family protein [Ramlibacter sp.]|uniref:TlpA family protein disulfide reductase n=1 Tax=Ramlibacter sp. TaxID=1917967 RepID=UPI002D809A50|nr:TlpA disulfide reductase family protein [Ramlibacter sp.]HET8747868.1 TlpA disulfide reductase family protein [Ramlibacter sp.]